MPCLPVVVVAISYSFTFLGDLQRICISLSSAHPFSSRKKEVMDVVVVVVLVFVVGVVMAEKGEEVEKELIA